MEDVEATVRENQSLSLGVEPVALGAHFSGAKGAREKLGKRLSGVHET
jgi:hypothetical protein